MKLTFQFVRAVGALLTILVTLGLVVADAFTAMDMLTPERLQALFVFIGLLLGIDMVSKKTPDLEYSIGLRNTEEDDDDDA